MTRAGLMALIPMVLLWGCGGEALPPGVLTKEEYAAFLMEVYLAEARINNHAIARDSAAALYFSFEEKLLLNKGLSDSVIKATYQYYLSRPQELEEIYTAVVDSLSLREQRYKGAVDQ